MEQDKSDIEAFKAQSAARAKAREAMDGNSEPDLTDRDNYVKQTYSLAWRFFKHHKIASFIAMGVIFVLYIFSMIPLIGFFVAIAVGIVDISIQVYIAKLVEYSESDEEYDNNVMHMSPSDLLIKYFGTAAGAYLGFILVGIIIFVVLGVIASFTVGTGFLTAMVTGEMEPENQMQLVNTLSGLLFPVGLFFLFYGYIYPLVFGRVISSNSFGDAFKSMLLVFSPNIWKASFNVKYMLLMLALHGTGILTAILAAICAMTFVLIPVAFFLVYLFVVYMAIVSVNSYRIVYAASLADEKKRL
jgi:hypothetical protein